MTDSAEATELKKALRTQVLALRERVGAAQREHVASFTFARLLALEQYHAAASVFAYAGFGSELDTRPLLGQIVSDGKQLVMSRVDKASRALRLYKIDDLDAQLRPGVWGIMEPDPARCTAFERARLDLIVMPGAVFDEQCGRIGYGAGYYDALIATLEPRPYLVAPAFDLQVLPRVPMLEHDQRLDRIITERREFVWPTDCS